MPQPLIILAPGLLCDDRLFEPIMDVFHSRGLDTLVVPHHLDDSLHGIVERLRQQVAQTREVVLIGLSMGGYIVLESFFAGLGDVKGLVLLNSNARADRDEQITLRKRLIAQSKLGRFTGVTKKLAPMFLSPQNAQNPALVSLITGMGEHIGRDGYVRQQTAIMGRKDRLSDLKMINVPTLIMVGAEDKVTPPKVSQEMHENITGSELVIVPNCGHLVTLEAPKIVCDYLGSFLDQLI